MVYDPELGYDPDLPRPPGDYADGAHYRYTEKAYTWPDFGSDIGTAMVRVTLRITGGAVAGGQTIHRWITQRERSKLVGQGYGVHEIYDAAETQDDMEYFVRKMREAGRNGEDYSMP